MTGPAFQLSGRSRVIVDNDVDQALVARYRDGDKDAFAELVVRYQRPIYNAAFWILRSADDARDVAQDVFLRVAEHLDEFDGQHRFFSWIYRIAVNESSDRLQQRKRTCNWEDGAACEQDADWDSQPDALAGNGQLHDAVQASLMELKQEYRAVIVLRHFSECSYEQMAEILHIPEKTVKSRLYSARQSLREKLCAHGITEA